MSFSLQAENDVGLQQGKMEEIKVTNPQESAELIERVFKGIAPQSAENIVAINAAAALYVAGYVQTLADGVMFAKEAIQNGLALNQLMMLRHQVEENYA
jgi:anthranilate phosphoribosyltransferase